MPIDSLGISAAISDLNTTINTALPGAVSAINSHPKQLRVLNCVSPSAYPGHKILCIPKCPEGVV